MRVEFGDGIVGDLRVPPGGGPGVVLTGPFTGVRDQVVGLYAERLAALGFATLAFDHRNWGESEGEPRCHEDPEGKLRDLRQAVSCLRSVPEVGEIGAVGIGVGAGYALKFAAFDPRVRAFAGIGGSYGNPYTSDFRDGLEELVGALEREDLGGPVAYLPAVSPDGIAAMPGDEPFGYYGTARGASPTWRDEVTRASLLALGTVDHVMGADFLSPKPALIVHGVIDRHCPPEGAEEVFRRLDEPKRLLWLDCRQHTDLFDREPYVTEAVAATAEFLHEILT